ncbi:MAG: heat-shock protein Hsp90 [Fretibacterium sp.]|nr:heat-shock protein Hsp90 [Fretibacterium sp.]
MNKEDLVQKVHELISAPSCCSEAKAAGQAYLDAEGTTGEKAAARALIAELEEDVCSIDDMIAFADSDRAKGFLGEEAAKGLAERGRKAKAEGGKHCLCLACSAGAVILENRDVLL